VNNDDGKPGESWPSYAKRRPIASRQLTTPLTFQRGDKAPTLIPRRPGQILDYGEAIAARMG
jgi:hypothetical protein